MREKKTNTKIKHGESVDWLAREIRFPPVKPEDKNGHMKQELVIENIPIPAEVLEKGPYCVRVEVVRKDRQTKARGWSFEAAGFMQSSKADRSKRDESTESSGAATH